MKSMFKNTHYLISVLEKYIHLMSMSTEQISTRFKFVNCRGKRSDLKSEFWRDVGLRAIVRLGKSKYSSFRRLLPGTAGPRGTG